MSRIESLHAAPKGHHALRLPPPPSAATGSPPTRRPPAGQGGPPPALSRSLSRSLPRRRPGILGWLAGWGGRLRDAAEALTAGQGGRQIHEFADLVSAAREPEQVESALVALAGELSNACRVELMLDSTSTNQGAPRLLAVWPEASKAMTPSEVEALGYPLCLGLWCGDRDQMTLQLYARPGQYRGGHWPKPVLRRLTTLCAMAATAERGLHAGRRARAEIPTEALAAVRDATFLSAILPYALAQAHRHREPLTILAVEIDALAALHSSLGAERADLAVRRVSEAIARTLRGSDVVARLDDDRIVVVLPNTGSADSLVVAEVVRTSIAAVCQPTDQLPELSASMGVSFFPEDAPDMPRLLAAADEAMTRARSRGRNQVATFSTPSPRLVGRPTS